MQRFLLSFLFFLSCGLNSGYTEIFTPKKQNFDTKLNNAYLSVEPFRCKHNEECQSFILNSECIENSCKCAGDSVLSSDASKCLARAKGFGSPCEDNVQCSELLSSGGVCENSKCSCKSGYHYLKGACWKNVGLSERCFRNEQCFSSYEYVGLNCENNICKCRPNYYRRLDAGCRRIRKIGESCNLDDDCEKGSCESMECSEEPNAVDKTLNSFSNITIGQAVKNIGNCSEGMFELDGKCVLELGMPCTEDSECNHIDKAICLDNTLCACEPVLYVASDDNRKCLRVPRGKVDDIYRSSCLSNSQCGVFGPNSYCKNKRCACKDETYFDMEKKFCWAIKSLNEICTVDKDCHPSLTHAECKKKASEKKCLCQNGYHQKDLECVPDALEVGDSCEKDEDCLFDHSFCNATNVCACKKHYYLDKGKCKPGVGTTCIKNEDCAPLENTECKIGQFPILQCLCKENQINSPDFKYCLPASNYKDACAESFQCEYHLGNLGECRGNICECREGAHYSYGKCYQSKFVGQHCSRRQECFPGNDTNSVICLKGFCQCNYDYELDKSEVCVKTNSATTVKLYWTLLTSLIVFLALR